MPLVIDTAALPMGIDDEIVRSDRGLIDDGETRVSYSRALTGQGRSHRGVREVVLQSAAADQKRAAGRDEDRAALGRSVVVEGRVGHDRPAARLHEQAAAFSAGTCLLVAVDLDVIQVEDTRGVDAAALIEGRVFADLAVQHE